MAIDDSQNIVKQQLIQSLEDLEGYIKDLWQFLPLPICYVNPYQNVLDANSAIERFLKLKSLEMVGEKIDKFFVDKSHSRKIYERILKEKIIINEECEVLTKDNEKKIVNVSGASRDNGGGHIIGYYLAFSDIGELKRLQEELEGKVKERTKELQKRIEELEKFQKVAVGRELKMIELKKEIGRFKKIDNRDIKRINSFNA